MDQSKKIKAIKTGLFAFYYLTFFIPVYSTVVWGSTLTASVSELNWGTFFTVFFLVVFAVTIFVMYYKERLLKPAYITTLVFIGLLLFLLVVGKDVSTFKIAFYFQILIYGLLIYAMIAEEKTVKMYDFVAAKIKVLIKKIEKMISSNENLAEETTKIKEKEEE